MKIIYLLFIIFYLSISAYGQTYKIFGTVKDTAGNPLIGANVIVNNSSLGDAADAGGRYEIRGLKPGIYEIEVSIIGYEKQRIANLQIIDKDVELNFTLKTQSLQTEQIIISASKYEQNISELPVSADIIPPDEFSEKNYINIKEALRFVPGVNMVEDQISIRGSSGYSRGAGARVLLAIDGIPFYSGDTGEIIWEIIPVNEIERVEIIKGSSSSLYGSTAIGGVVNVITRKTQDKSFTYIRSLIGGYDKPSYKEWDWSGEYRLFNYLSASHSTSIGNLGISAALTRIEDEGYKQSGYFHRYLGYLKAAYNISPKSSLNLFVNTLNHKTGNFIYWKNSANALVPPDADQGQSVTTDRYMSGLIYNNNVSETVNLTFRGSYYFSHWRDQSSSANNSRANVFRGEIQATHKFSDDLVFIVGTEGSRGIVNSNLFGDPVSTSAGAYFQADYHFAFPLTMTAGVRYDYSKLHTLKSLNSFSPKAGMNYKIADNIFFRSSIGTGFRAPSLAEAYISTFVSGITIKPNPLLKSEKSVTFEAGISYEPLRQLKLDAAYFHNNFRDFIEPGIDRRDNKGLFLNVNRAKIEGGEFSINLQPLNMLNINLSYTYMWTRDVTLNKALKYRPRHLFYGDISYSFLGIEVGADFRFWSKVEEIDFELIELGFVPEGDKRVDVYVLDLRTAYNLIQLGLPARIFLSGKNVLNYNYVELIGNLAPIRNISFGFELYL